MDTQKLICNTVILKFSQWCPFTEFFREEQHPHLFKVDESIGIDEDTAKRVIAHYNECKQYTK